MSDQTIFCSFFYLFCNTFLKALWLIILASMDFSEQSFGEVKDVVKKARTASAPGPNAIPYKVYKMCPLLLRRLWRLSKVV